MRRMVFRLAPMSGLIFGMTCALLLVPIGFLAAPLFDARLFPLAPVGAVIALLHAFIWLYMRPNAFVLGPEGLDILWPLRRRRIPRAKLLGASEIGREALREEFGLLLRVGAGGLWGGFGLAWSSRGEYLGLYVSRHADGFVLVRCRGARSLLITPERPDAFVAALPSA
jgi:hypothetical protein